MGPVPRGFRMGSSELTRGQSRLGSVREPMESSDKSVRVSMFGSPGLGRGRDDVCPAPGPGDLCVPAVDANITVSHEAVRSDTVQSHTDRTVVGSSEVDANPSGVGTSTCSEIPEGLAAPVATPLGTPLPEVTGPQSEVSDIGKARLLALGHTESVAATIAHARAPTTMKQYQSKWALFKGWCDRELPPVEATEPSVPVLARFLNHFFLEKGWKVATVQNYKTAVAFHWRKLKGFKLDPEDESLHDLLSGFKRIRGKEKKRPVPWDIALVLEFLKSARFADWQKVTLEDLTIKTVFLIALASGKRRGELHALTREGVVNAQAGDGKVLYPKEGFLSKAHLRNDLASLKPVFIPRLSTGDTLLCPVESLDKYLERTDAHRSQDQKQLFISFKKGKSSDITPQTISNYIIKAIRLAYQAADVDEELRTKVDAKAHDTRRLSMSLKAFSSFSMQEVLEAGTWSAPNSFISHYLQNYSAREVENLATVGGFVAGGSQI